MSASELPFDENARHGRLYASRGTMRPEIKQFTQDDAEFKEAMVPRHRIPGKQTMPPYLDVPAIKVPEPRKSRSASRGRIGSSSKSMERPVNSKLEVSEPICMNGAMVMIVPESSLPKELQWASSAERKASSTGTSSLKATTTSSFKEERKSKKSVSFASSTAPPSTSTMDMTGVTPLGRKIPPLYIPRGGLKQEVSEPESEEDSEASTDSKDTPWGRKMTGIKVTRVRRDPNEEYVEVEAPENSLPVCARCGVGVYLAEEMKAAGRRFHAQCFRCFLCNTGLDSLKVHERNQEVYCKPCYLRQFGPKGYDYGAGEGALRME